MFDIANVAFSQVSDREKKAYEGKVKETGSYQGYKLRQYWVYSYSCSRSIILTQTSLAHRRRSAGPD